MSEVHIRPATPADRDRVVELDELTSSTLTTPAPAPGRDPFARRRPEDHLVAEELSTASAGGESGVVVGYVTLGHPTPLPASEHVWEVQGLAVLPAAAGRGVGRALVEAAAEEARRRGGRKVSLRVLAHNHTARRLYERAGFEVEGILRAEFLLDGTLVDDVLMARHLDDRAGS